MRWPTLYNIKQIIIIIIYYIILKLGLSIDYNFKKSNYLHDVAIN